MPRREWTAADAAEVQQAKQVAIRTRNAALERLEAGDMDLDDILELARVSEPVGRIRMRKAMQALGWTKVQFVEAVTELGLGVDRNLRWWSSIKGKSDLTKLRAFIAQYGERNSAPDGFPFRAPDVQVPLP